MPERITKTETIHDYEIKEISFEGGKTDYALIGRQNQERNPYLFIPGFSANYVGNEPLARALSDDDRELVIVAGQPGFRAAGQKAGKKTDILELHADAVLAIVKDLGFEQQQLDIVCHSMGMLILERAAQKAKDLGYSCFDVDEGSHSYAIAPAGFVPEEKLSHMAGRFVGLLAADWAMGKKYDADRKIAQANTKALAKNPSKSVKEVATILKTKVEFDKLGSIGLKPFVLVPGNDKMFPYHGKRGEVGPTIERELGLGEKANHEVSLAGAATPITPDFATRADYETFRALPDFEADKKAAKDAWLDSNSRSGHADLAFVPKRVASAIKQIRNLQYAHPEHWR